MRQPQTDRHAAPSAPLFSSLTSGAAQGQRQTASRTAPKGIMTAAELRKARFDVLPFTGKWLRLIGQPTSPFKIMFYGLPGSGKSSLSLQFAGYLAKSLSMRVLYVASEEGLTYTMADKLQRFGVESPNIDITPSLPDDLGIYDVIFIDSVNHAGLDAESLRKLDPSKSYVYVFQSTKMGQFRGSNDYLHDVDACIKVVRHASADVRKTVLSIADRISKHGQ